MLTTERSVTHAATKTTRRQTELDSHARLKKQTFKTLKSSQVHRTPSLIGNIPLDDNLAVGIRNLYALRLQNIPENQQRLSTDVGNAVLGSGDPKAQNKLQRAIAECRQVTDDSALRQNSRSEEHTSVFQSRENLVC